jgi:hypothetical protein
MHKVAVINIAPAMKDLDHGTHAKDMFVCHETVSYNRVGLSDIYGLEGTLQEEGFGIHGMTDREGHKAWARGMGNAIFWHAGGVNDRAVGVENISEIPIMVDKRVWTHARAHTEWLKREKQLAALAILIACWHNADQAHHPIVRSNGNNRGICSHWNVSQHHAASKGHWDCWPFDEGGYFPLAHVIDLARIYAKTYQF